MSHGDYIPKLSQIIQISFQRVGDIPTEVAIYLCAFQDLGFRGVQGEPLLSEGNAEVRKGSFTVGFAGNMNIDVVHEPLKDKGSATHLLVHI